MVDKTCDLEYAINKQLSEDEETRKYREYYMDLGELIKSSYYSVERDCLFDYNGNTLPYLFSFMDLKEIDDSASYYGDMTFLFTRGDFEIEFIRYSTEGYNGNYEARVWFHYKNMSIFVCSSCALETLKDYICKNS